MSSINSTNKNKIFLLQGKIDDGTYQEIASGDIKGLQKILTQWLMNNGTGFIIRLGDMR